MAILFKVLDSCCSNCHSSSCTSTFLLSLLTQEVHLSTRGETFYCSLCGIMGGQKKIPSQGIHFTTVEKQLS